MSIEAMKQALEALEWNLPVIEDYGDKEQLNRQHKAITALRQAIAEAEKQERFFCERCGKRLSGGIHTCTPPAEAEKQIEEQLKMADENQRIRAELKFNTIAEAEKQEPKCAVIVEVFGKDWRLEYMSLPVGRHKLYAQQYIYTHQPKQESVVYELSPTDIYDFAGWLTTRKGLMQVGGAYEAGPMAEAVGEYLKTYPERFTAKPKREWVGLTELQLLEAYEEEQQGRWGDHVRGLLAIEAKLKEKNT